MKVCSLLLALAGWDMLADEVNAPATADASTAEADRSGTFDAPPARPAPRRLVVYTADWCGPCRAFERDTLPKLAAAGWRVGDGPADHVRVVDITSNPIPGVTALPTFVLLKGDREVRRHVGRLDAWGVGEFVKGYSERPAVAHGPATTRRR